MQCWGEVVCSTGEEWVAVLRRSGLQYWGEVVCSTGSGLLLGAGLVGALLVIAGDFVGQFLLPARLPVGVVTGAVGAPFLLYLIVRANRNGGTL